MHYVYRLSHEGRGDIMQFYRSRIYIFLLLALYPSQFHHFNCYFLPTFQSDAIFVLTAGQKAISRDKNDIAEYIAFMSPCYCPDKGTSM